MRYNRRAAVAGLCHWHFINFLQHLKMSSSSSESNSDKVILVTGASAGIGVGISTCLAKYGFGKLVRATWAIILNSTVVAA